MDSLPTLGLSGVLTAPDVRADLAIVLRGATDPGQTPRTGTIATCVGTIAMETWGEHASDQYCYDTYNAILLSLSMGLFRSSAI